MESGATGMVSSPLGGQTGCCQVSPSCTMQPGQGWGSRNVAVEGMDSPRCPPQTSMSDVELGGGSTASFSPVLLLRQLSGPDSRGGGSCAGPPVWHLANATELLRCEDVAKPALHSPSILSARSFADRHRNLAFWMRAALVLILAVSVLGTVLIVLRLYNRALYHEADKLGLRLLHRCATVAHLEMAEFVDELAMSTRVLSGNLHGQGIVPLLSNNIYHPLARKLLWETFQAVPDAEVASYGNEQGAVSYLRIEGETAPFLIKSRPIISSQPMGNWVVAMAPVHPMLGTWVVPEESVPLIPWEPVPSQPYYQGGLSQPKGTVGWWAGLTRGGRNMVMTLMFGAHMPLVLDGEGAGAADSDNATDRDVTGGGQNVTDAEPTDGGAPAGTTIGVVGMTKSSLSLRTFMAKMDTSLQGGRLFFSRVEDGTLVFANEGALFQEGGNPPAFTTITADMSDDPVIAAAGRHLRARFLPVASTPTQRLHKEPDNTSSEVLAVAARFGLCWEEYEAAISVNGRRWYLHCQGSMYGGAHGLLLAGVMLLPHDAIMGEMDRTRQRTVAVVVGAALAFAVLGVVGVYVTTVYVKKMAKDTRVLQGMVGKQEGELEKLSTQLDNMRSLLSRGDPSASRSVDMRSPMETIHDLLMRLAEQNQAPTAETLAVIQMLLRMPEPHMPIVLQEALGHRDGGASMGLTSPLVQAMGGVPSEMLDDDLSSWLRSTVMRLPQLPSIHNSALARMGSVAFYRRSEADDTTHGSSPSRTRGSSSHGDDTTLDAITNIMCQVVQQGCTDDEMALTDYGTYPKQPASDPVPPPLPAGKDDDGLRDTLQVMPQFLNQPTPARQRLRVEGSGLYAPVHPATLSIRASLEGIGRWNFDTMELAVASHGRPILWMGLELFRRAGLLKVFSLPLDKLTRFLVALDEGMPPNHYHNATHIADVSNSLYHIIRHSGVGSYLLRLDVLAAITAALVHDFRHPGVNNDFVVRASDELALRYNDRTVLENFHVAEAFILLAAADMNFLHEMDREDFKYVRNVVIELVLGSDLKRHFELVELFKKRVKDKEAPLSRENESDRLLLMQVALKVADIGHAAKKLAIHQKWTDAITEEFYLQGDKERAAGFKVSPFMDRENNDLPKSQLGFFSFIALPLYEAWVGQFPDSLPILDEMMGNIKYWERVRDNKQNAL